MPTTLLFPKSQQALFAVPCIESARIMDLTTSLLKCLILGNESWGSFRNPTSIQSRYNTCNNKKKCVTRPEALIFDDIKHCTYHQKDTWRNTEQPLIFVTLLLLLSSALTLTTAWNNLFITYTNQMILLMLGLLAHSSSQTKHSHVLIRVSVELTLCIL